MSRADFSRRSREILKQRDIVLDLSDRSKSLRTGAFRSIPTLSYDYLHWIFAISCLTIDLCTRVCMNEMKIIKNIPIIPNLLTADWN